MTAQRAWIPGLPTRDQALPFQCMVSGLLERVAAYQ